MTRGKYAARAANRLAEIDAGIIAELREKLATVTAERDAARSEIERLCRDQTTLAREQAQEIAGLAISDLQVDLIAAQEGRDQDRRNYFRAVLGWMERDGVKVNAAWERMAELGELFGIPNREAAEIFRVNHRSQNRDDKRANMRDLRRMGEINRREAGRDPKQRMERIQKGLPL